MALIRSGHDTLMEHRLARRAIAKRARGVQKQNVEKRRERIMRVASCEVCARQMNALCVRSAVKSMLDEHGD